MSEAEALAEKIVSALFKSANGTAHRLQLRGAREEDLGGWCRGAARDRIATVLRCNEIDRLSAELADRLAELREVQGE